MDCQRCESLLLDLAYGELAPSDEAEARAHVARCAQCGTALERISSGLVLAKQMPLVDPPASLSDNVMRAARAQAQDAKPAESVPFFDRMVDVLRHFAMARQVQMATVMLLIVVIGLWSVPELTRRREAQGGTVVGPDDHGEAGPSAALAPAEPLDLAVDRRTGRIRAKGDLPEPTPARADAEKLAVANAGEARKAEGDSMDPEVPAELSPEAPLAEAPGAVAPMKGADDVAATAQAAPAEAKHEALMAAEGELAVHAFAPPPPAAAAAPKMARRAAPTTEALMPSPTRSSSGGAATLGSGGAALDDADGSALARQAERAAAPSYAAALERFRAGDYRASREMLLAVLARREPAQRTGALLFLARSERALGQCHLAVARYEQLVLRDPATQEAQQALPEAVGCYDLIGQRARADSLLDRATRLPALAARARSLQQARQVNAASADTQSGDK